MRIVAIGTCLVITLSACEDTLAPVLDGSVGQPDTQASKLDTQAGKLDTQASQHDANDGGGGPLPACQSAVESWDPCALASFSPCYVEGRYCGHNGFHDQFRTCVCLAGKVSCTELTPSEGASCSQIPAGKSCTTGEMMLGGDHCTCRTNGTWACTHYAPADAGFPG